MALSRIIRIATGSSNTFAVSFALGFEANADISARVEGELADRNIDFSVPGFMTLDGATIAADLEVAFLRTVSRDSLDVDWADGAALTGDNMDKAQLQALRLVHEALDRRFEAASGDMDINGYRLTNVGTPVDDTDGVNKQYVDAGIPVQVAAAEAAAASAIGSAAASDASADTATTQAGLADAARIAAEAAADGLTAVADIVAQIDPDDLVRKSDASVTGYDFVNSAGPLGAGATKLPAESVVKSYVDNSHTTVTPQMFGAVGDYDYNTGTGTDDTAAFQAALDSAKGNVFVPVGKYLINGNLIVPRAASLRGPHVRLELDNRDGGAMLDQSTLLFVNSAATITMKESSGLTGLGIMRKGCKLGESKALFAGVGITIGEDEPVGIGFSSTGVSIQDNFIAGFGVGIQALIVPNNERMFITGNRMDNNHGLFLETSFDICHIRDNHCFPYITAGGADEALRRPGVGFYLNGIDWPTLSGNFSFGYAWGLVIENCNNAMIIQHGADYTATVTGSNAGIEIKGTSTEVTIVGARLAAQNFGLHVNSATAVVTIEGSILWGNVLKDIQVTDGQVSAIGNNFRKEGSANPIGIGILASADGTSFVDQNHFVGYSASAPINDASSKGIVGNGNTFDTCQTQVVVKTALPIIASAATISIPPTGDVFHVSGSTNISNIVATTGWAGRRITLFFALGLTLSGGSGLFIFGGNLVVLGGLSIELFHDGITWVTKSVYK
jgi:hypothetical protein